jgi:hypothetical protein
MTCAAGSWSARAQNGNLQFSASAYLAKESAGAAKITVKRTGGSSGTISVNFSTLDDAGSGTSAIAGLDYYPTNGTLTFEPGVTTRIFYVPLINDTAHEGNETVVLALSDVSEGGTLGSPDNATLTITDNDVCSYAVDPPTRTANEVGGLDAFHVVAPDGCDWIAVSTGVGWLQIFSGGSGSGNGEVTYSYDPLPEGTPSRSATISVAGKTFTLTQLKPPPDLTPPVVTFLTPAQGSRQITAGMTVTGRTTDAGGWGVTNVSLSLSNANGTTEFAPASGLASWSADVSDLVPGTNTIRVQARDAAGNVGEAERSIVYVQVSALVLTKSGLGTVSPLANGQVLDVGKHYTLTAKPGAGHFFQNWSFNGGEGPADNPLTFEMTQDLALQANFVASPFTSLAGVYNGLFLEEGGTRQESSGFVSLKMGPMGTFSAKMIVAGQRVSFSGRFGLDGSASNTITRAQGPALTVLLNLDLVGGTDAIVGSVSDGTWHSNLAAYRDVFERTTYVAPQAGRYTLRVPGDVDHPDEEPAGDGCGTVLVGEDGSVKLSGTLADGTKLTQKVALSKDGWWPLYVPLYAGRGALVCWVVFGDGADSDFSGAGTWIKPADAAAHLYPAGFSAPATIAGARYTPPTTPDQRVLALTEGQVRFTKGNQEDFANGVTIAADGKVANQGANKLVFSIQKSSGLFKGSVSPPGSALSILIRGAVNQKANDASGFFLGTTQSGQVRLSE